MAPLGFANDTVPVKPAPICSRARAPGEKKPTRQSAIILVNNDTSIIIRRISVLLLLL